MIRKEDFSFELPEDRIAQHPIERRDASRLMCLDGSSGAIEHHRFYELPELLQPNDCLVINDSRVIPARLYGARKDTQTPVELLLLKRINRTDWETLARPGRRVRRGHQIILMPGRLEAEVLAVLPNGNRQIRFIFDGIWEEVLQEAGTCPLPPYIHEQLDDPERYQTVYAEKDGSAAAPTAGLHFTPALIEQLKAKQISVAPLTLHVGLGTFRPVRTENIRNHTLHEEYFELPDKTVRTIEKTHATGGRVIAVGTTSCRVLESVARREGHLKACSGWTDIFIFPGFQFQVIDLLITNFHLPESTLIMLVSAFAGREQVLSAYDEAIRQRYRFFSFGDAMLVSRKQEVSG